MANWPAAVFAQPMPWLRSSRVPFRMMSAFCRLVVQPPTPRPLPAKGVVEAMPLTTSAPLNELLLSRRFTPLPALAALIVQVPEPCRPPSR